MKVSHIILAIVVSLLVSGCSTSGNFKIPEGSELYLHRRPQPVMIQDNGNAVTRPFFWTAAAGVPYRLEKNGQTIKEGRLRSRFRVVSIFWPPYALIYWPMGLNPYITYDLINDKQE